MDFPQQGDADPVAVVLDWLTGHPDVATILGGTGHVSGVAEDPWPHLVVDEGPTGDMRNYEWDAEYEVTLELRSHPNGAPGKAQMRDQLVRILRIVRALPDEQVVTDTTPVVSRVRPAGVYSWQPLTSGALTVRASVYVTIRPPLRLPAP